jgi:hypothetical protein
VYFYTGSGVDELMRGSGWSSWDVKKIGKLHFVVAESDSGKNTNHRGHREDTENTEG